MKNLCADLTVRATWMFSFCKLLWGFRENWQYFMSNLIFSSSTFARPLAASLVQQFTSCELKQKWTAMLRATGCKLRHVRQRRRSFFGPLWTVFVLDCVDHVQEVVWCKHQRRIIWNMCDFSCGEWRTSMLTSQFELHGCLASVSFCGLSRKLIVFMSKFNIVFEHICEAFGGQFGSAVLPVVSWNRNALQCFEPRAANLDMSGKGAEASLGLFEPFLSWTV